MSPRKRRSRALYNKIPVLEEKREHIITEPWKELDTKQQTAHILYKGTNYERTASMIKKMWEHMKDLLRPP